MDLFGRWKVSFTHERPNRNSGLCKFQASLNIALKTANISQRHQLQWHVSPQNDVKNERRIFHTDLSSDASSA